MIYRFADSDKNPLKRHELGALIIEPPLVGADGPAYAAFEFSRVLDSSAPGQNFSIGRGLGVSIEVEKTSDGTLELVGPQSLAPAALHVGSARLTFASRTINDNVVV